MKMSIYRNLCEALLRYTRFHSDKPLDSPRAWVGMGYPREYRDAINEGYMRHAGSWDGRDVGSSTPRIMGWFSLTPKGAAIVQKWLEQGYDYRNVESGEWLPLSEND